MRAVVTRRADTGAWTVRWRESNSRRRRSFASKRDAEDFAKAVERRLALGGIDLDAGAITLAEFVEEYWIAYALPNLAENTRTVYRGVWDRHLRPRIGGMALREITPAVVEDLRVQLHAAGVGDPTIIKALGFLQGVMKRAVVRGRIQANPVREVDKPRQGGVRRAHPLAPETVEAIRAQMRPYDATLVTVLAYVGLRPDEATNLRIENLSERRVYVASNKTGKERDVDLLPVVRQDLHEWVVTSGIRAGLLFPRRASGEWSDHDWRNWRRRVYQAAARAAGVTGDLRPYRLRGSYGSLLLYEGKPVTYVAEQLGHSVATLSRHYAGVIARLEEAPRVSADEAIRAARESVSQRGNRMSGSG